MKQKKRYGNTGSSLKKFLSERRISGRSIRRICVKEKELSALSYMDDTFGRTGNSLARPFVLSKIVELCHCRLQIPASEIWKL